MPECDCVLAQVVVMLSESEKSIRVYEGYNTAKSFVNSNEGYPVRKNPALNYMQSLIATIGADSHKERTHRAHEVIRSSCHSFLA